LDLESSNEVLRLWELTSPCVVLGRASKWSEEVHREACLRDGVAILRRASGGATIVAGPGCLMYSVLISYAHRPTWRALDMAHREVMQRTRAAVQATTDRFELGLQIQIDGTCDLKVADRKFSGNAMRCKRNWMIYHGTIMYAMKLEYMTEYLREPPRQPKYRMQRTHASFVTNLLQDSDEAERANFRANLEHDLATQFSATQSWRQCPLRNDVVLECTRLRESRYSNPQWHFDR
jgi:lipoate---protein ligase